MATMPRAKGQTSTRENWKGSGRRGCGFMTEELIYGTPKQEILKKCFCPDAGLQWLRGAVKDIGLWTMTITATSTTTTAFTTSSTITSTTTSPITATFIFFFCVGSLPF
eukprot:GHVT01063978.1.p2 GENE.GHVT01063978.1~~GHVT01063978.1.p2  ORF type:complete len:109 (+),score=8.42 GHVT01063978.1:340-666(+)